MRRVHPTAGPRWTRKVTRSSLRSRTRRDALAAARSITERLGDGPVLTAGWVHTGAPLVTDEGYVGGDVHRAARIAAAGHGGQVLVSASTATLVDACLSRDLGEHRFEGLESAGAGVPLLGDEAFRLCSRCTVQPSGVRTPFLGARLRRGRSRAARGSRHAAAGHADRAGDHRQDPGYWRALRQAAAESAGVFPTGASVRCAPVRERGAGAAHGRAGARGE